jgi:gas vesicle protein
MSEKDTKNLISLADKEDELDDLLDKISGVFEESVDWLEDNFNEAIRQLSDADMAEDYRDGLSTLDDIQAEIKNLLKIRNENYHLIEQAEQLEDEVHELRKKI